eukprot:scaffold9047_cov139-Isochrysis_galbana.AAC.2
MGRERGIAPQITSPSTKQRPKGRGGEAFDRDITRDAGRPQCVVVSSQSAKRCCYTGASASCGVDWRIFILAEYTLHKGAACVEFPLSLSKDWMMVDRIRHPADGHDIVRVAVVSPATVRVGI